MLEANNITFQIGDKKILDNITLKASIGEVLAICGPNGAGKSTLLKVMSGELQPTNGEVKIDQRQITQWDSKELATARASLQQQSLLSFPFSVREVVALGRFPYARDENRKEIVSTCLYRVGMLSMSERIYTTLSGGEKQRVHLARVLAQLMGSKAQHKLLLLDEPTSALDLPHQEKILEIASNYAKSDGYAVIVVLHDLNLASAWADRILFLSNGCHGAEGTPYEVIAPDVIRSIYGLDTHIIHHPDTGRPLVLVRRTPQTRSADMTKDKEQPLE